MAYLPLSTANLPDPVIDPAMDVSPEDYFDTAVYTGNGSDNSVTSLGFQPDFIWIKNRTSTGNHVITDALSSFLPQSSRSPTGGSLSNTYNLTISSDTQNYSVLKQAIAAGYDGEGLCTVNVTVNSGVVVGSISTYLPALDFRGFPTGCSLNLTVNSTAYVVGAGGTGGAGSSWGVPGAPGSDGGDAIWASSAMSITNNGTIAGGGGGGGAGGGSAPTGAYGTPGGNGGGGAGNIVGIGAGPRTASAGYTSAKATDGTLTTGGTGTTSPAQSGGLGGNGGDLGADGTSGQNGQTAWNGNTAAVGGAGGSAGRYADGNSFITWVSAGTRLGNVSSTPSKSGNIYLSSNTTTGASGLSNGIGTVSSTGFSFGNSSLINTNSNSYVAWTWKANGPGVTNTDGSITSTVSANTTSGFSIVSYTGTGANATVGHGLGVAPSMVIIKQLDGTGFWVVGHDAITWNSYLRFNDTTAIETSIVAWNNTAPTSSTVSLGTSNILNGSGSDLIMYAFAEKDGFSKFGSYIGNGSANGPFVYTGFRPAWVLIKRATTTGAHWRLNYTAAQTANGTGFAFMQSPSTASADITSEYDMDILSNGFKLRDSTQYENLSGATFVYAAFAENPFKYSNAR